MAICKMTSRSRSGSSKISSKGFNSLSIDFRLLRMVLILALRGSTFLLSGPRFFDNVAEPGVLIASAAIDEE